MIQNMSAEVNDDHIVAGKYEIFDANNGFVVAEEYLKTSFDGFITKHFMEIAQILQQKIMSTNAENGFTNLNVSGSAAVKNVTGALFTAKIRERR